MIRRFQIDDLISQDEFGVVFRALDTETGKDVAVRRFFPFGAAGGGLQPEEQSAYEVALGRLAGIHHPALRSVICGGCDPVDGMPYIATEWIEGAPLASYLEQGPLPAQTATELITQALEVSELLSQVLGEDAVWIETTLETIVVGDPQSGRGITFWICPLKWLGSHETPRGIECIAGLTDIMMGWQDQKINDQEGSGLAGWVKWLRHAEHKISLHEARETLAASVGVSPPTPVRRPAVPIARPVARPPKRSSSIAMWLINTTLAVTAGGLWGWHVLRQREADAQRFQPLADQAVTTKPSAKPAAIPPSETVAKVNADPAKPAATPAAPAGTAPPPPVTKVVAEEAKPPEKVADAPPATPHVKVPAPHRRKPRDKKPPPEADLSHTVVDWTSRGLLSQSNGKSVIVEGPLEVITFSDTKKTMYLMFSKELGETDTRGSVIVQGAPDDLSETSLTPLIGKQVRLHGVIHTQTVAGTVRPEVVITNRASIEEVK